MSAIFSATFPFFALVLCGYLAARRGVLPATAVPGLNTFVLYFALPCLLFRFGASQPLAQLLDPRLIGVYLAVAMGLTALAVAVSKRQGLDDRNAAFAALVTAFPNTGFMGVPLIVSLLGETASGPVVVTLLVDMIVTSSMCIVWAERGTHAGAARRALAAAARNPLPWSLLLGAAVGASGFALPGPIAQTVRMLGDAASPTALFTIGAVMAIAARQAAAPAPWREVLPATAMKLVLHPVLVGGTGLAARAAGIDVPLGGLAVLTLAAALPSASNVTLLAQRYGADVARLARIVLASTALAFLTFSTWAGWLAAR